MKKLLLSVTSLFLMAFSASANHDPYLQSQINQWVTPGNDLRIRQVLGMDQRYDGYEVEYVTFSAQSQYGYAAANLEINGYLVYPTQSISNGFYQYTIPVNRILGRDINTLQLSVNGGPVWISVIGVQLDDRRYNPQPEPGYPPRPGHPGNGGGYYPPRPRPGHPGHPGHPGRPPGHGGPGGPGRPGPGNPGRPGHPGHPGGPGRPGPGR